MPQHIHAPATGLPCAEDSSLYTETSFGNPRWADASARFLIVRLSPFRDVERSTPHQFLYREVRKAMPAAYLDFCFFPAAKERKWNEPVPGGAMTGMASSRPAREFDLMLISNAYTLELVNLLPWLVASGIPPSRLVRERAMATGEAVHPLIVLGGSNAMASASLHDETTGDSVVDAVFFGEAEGSLGLLAPALAEAARRTGRDRQDALAAIATDMTGFWPTASRAPVTQAKAHLLASTCVDSASPDVPGTDGWIAPPALAGEEAGTVRLEITRGCPSFCTFCFEGWERKPFREHTLESILAEARRLKAGSGASHIELASYNFNAHSRIVDIIKELHALFHTVTFQSQRVDILARSPGLIRFEAAAGKKSFTVGVEGISKRARAYYNKELAEGDLRSVLTRMIQEGARELKLFYILSGFEDDADLAEFSSFTGWLQKAVADRPAGAAPRVVFSVGELIRMPFTPLAHERLLLEKATYTAIANALGETVGHCGFEYRSPEHFDEYCLSQVLALPPEGCFGLLSAMAARGYVYDRNLSRGAWDFAHAWLTERGALTDLYLGEKPHGYRFPYSFVQPAASKEVIYRRFLDAKQRRESVSCIGAACFACGACDDDEERSAITSHTIDEATERDVREVEAVVAAKRKPYVTYVKGSIPPGSAKAHKAFETSMFLKSLYAALPVLVETVWTAEDAFLKTDDGAARLPDAWGDTCYRILSSQPIDAEILAKAGYESLNAPLAPERLHVKVRFEAVPRESVTQLVSAFLNEASIPHVLRKTGNGVELAIAGKGIKKRNVVSARIYPDAPKNGLCTVASLECGPKYDLHGLATLSAKRGIAYATHVSLGESRLP
jgi:hypothetical protein